MDFKGIRPQHLYIPLLLVLPFVFFAPGTRMELLLGDGDTYVHTLPVWTYVAERWLELSPPLWTPLVFGGYPIYAEPQTAVFHPFKLLFFVFSPFAAVNITVLLAYSLAGLFTFLLAREEGSTPEASLLAGFSFAFSGYLIGHQAMTGLLINAACFPVLFYFLRLLARRMEYRIIIAGAVSIMLLVLAGHPQMTFYALFFSLPYAFYLTVAKVAKTRRARYVAGVLLVYFLGAGLSAFQWLPTLELSRMTFRENLTYEAFSTPVLSPPELVSSLVSTRLFHFSSDQGSEAMLDLGLPVLLLALIGVLLAGRKSAFWIFLALFSALLYMGGTTPLYRIMYEIPGYNLFRLPSRNGVALDLALVMLAAFGLTALQQRTVYPSRLKRYILLGCIPPVYWLGLYRMEERVTYALWVAREQAGRALTVNAESLQTIFAPLFPQFLVMLLALVALTLLLLKVGGGKVAAMLLILFSFHHFWYYRNWIFTAPRAEVKQCLEQGIELPGNKELYRVAYASPYNWTTFIGRDRLTWRARYTEIAGPNLNLLQGLSAISGYGPLLRKDYSRLAGDMTTGGAIGDAGLFDSPALDLLNVRYVISPGDALGFPRDAFSKLALKKETANFAVYENTSALGVFWGVREVRPAGRDDFLTSLAAGDLNFSEVALLREQGGKGPLGGEYVMPDEIAVRRLRGNVIEASVKTKGYAFLASSQLTYPGWFAWMDGRRIKIHEINGLFAGLEVPPGTHHLHLRFIPLTLWGGLVIALVALALFLVIARKDILKLRLHEANWRLQT